MSKDFEVHTGEGVRLRIEGLSRTLRALSAAGADAEEMRDLMHSIGMLVVHAADTPVLTGRLSAGVRSGRGKTKAVVRAGGYGVPYAGVIHYGWPARNIPENPFLTNALHARYSAILSALQAGLDDLLKKNRLT